MADLVEGARRALGDNFVGVYLQGSFALGEADEWSDVDFLTVTESAVTAEQQASLQSLHERLYAYPVTWAQHLEGSYVTRDALRHPDTERSPWLYLDNGSIEFERDNHDNTAVVRWTLREHGVTLAGPNPRELVDPITSDQLRYDARWALGEWVAWFMPKDSTSRRGLAIAVLTICRILHTLAAGEVTPKPAAGRWAIDELDAEWQSLIQWALDDRADPWAKVREPADPALFERTKAFITYAANRGDA